MDGLFIAVGQAPQSAPFQEAVAVENGYYLAGEDTKTSLPGVFAAGDGRKKQVRQLTTAVSDGAAAALAACRYLEEQGQSGTQGRMPHACDNTGPEQPPRVRNKKSLPVRQFSTKSSKNWLIETPTPFTFKTPFSFF